MDDIKRICDKNNIAYFLIEGTLLGAVRHSGYIPWDDDIDIGMLRNDYERFLKVAQDELKSDYFLQTPFTDLESYTLFAKVRKNGTYIEEIGMEKCKCHKGIYVDIFPIDDIKGNTKLVEFRIAIIQRLAVIRAMKVYHYKCRRKITRFVMFLFKILPMSLLNKMIKYLAMYDNNKNARMVTNIYSIYGIRKQLVQREVYGKGKSCIFENREYTIPVSPDTILSQVYGDDYLQLPPVDERKSRHIYYNLKV